MSKLDKKRNLIMLVILVLSLLVLLIAFLFTRLSRLSDNEKDEMQEAAVSLVERNFDVVTYYKISELPYAEKYDASLYEDGTLPCSTDIFKDYNALCDFVRETYISSTAEIIINSKVGDKPRYFDNNGIFCKTVADTDTSYDKNLSSYKVQLMNMTKNHSDIEVTLNTKSTSEEVKIKLSMSKKNGKWLLDDIIY